MEQMLFFRSKDGGSVQTLMLGTCDQFLAGQEIQVELPGTDPRIEAISAAHEADAMYLLSRAGRLIRIDLRSFRSE
ncbi:MAG: hypothetical protein HUU20_22475 [Pirellulales bacterium]|nr:hypothetical protein [Pirellulales bacterium]